MFASSRQYFYKLLYYFIWRQGRKICVAVYWNIIRQSKEFFPPPTTEIFQFARDLTAGDSQIKNMDALIASHALTDPKSTRLITGDKNLLNSTAVRKIESDLQDDGKREMELRITDGLGH